MRRLLVCTQVLRDCRRIAAVLSTASVRAALAAGLALTVSISAPPPRAQDRSQADLTREDLEVARTEYVLATKSYPPGARDRALRLLDEGRSRAGQLSKSELHLRLLELVALTDNAHDALSFGSDSARPIRRMPYRVAWFPDGIVIMRVMGDSYRDLAGARIEAIDGVPEPELYRRLSRYAGGVEGQRKLSLGLFLESPELLHATGIARTDDAVTLELRIGKRRVTRSISAMPGSMIPRGVPQDRLLYPDPIAAGEPGWMPALPLAAAPLAFRDGNDYFRLLPLEGVDALYVQFRINFTFAGQDIDRFQARVLDTIDRTRPANIVLDQRFNTGGDLQSTLALMRSLPSRVPGRVYVLISRYTFSAGIVSTAAVKKAGGNKAVLVGEPLGDRLRFWSEGSTACLPHSHLCLHRTDGLFDMAKGCTGEDGCYGDQFDVNVGSLEPEIRAPFTAADYLAGRDRAVEAVLARLRASH